MTNKRKDSGGSSMIIHGNSLDVLKTFDENSIDSIVTDPPYELGFMGKKWDSTGVAFNTEIWELCLKVLKPGGHLLSFGGSRTFHRIAVAIEDAGFELRDTIMWVYGCLSEDTEILTENGWKNKNTITTNDIVFSMDLKKHKIVKSNINHIFEYEYNGKIINLKNADTDQLITPNHKVINKKGSRKQKSGKRHWYNEEDWVYRDAWQLTSDYYTLPLASTYDGNYSIGGDMAELIGWIISEGNFQKDCNAINIYQSSVNKDNVKRIRYCLNRLGIKYSEYQRNRIYKNRPYIEYQWYISGEYVDIIKEIIPNKLPTLRLLDLKLSEKERLITGLCRGDGSVDDNGKYITFYQNNIETLEWFQILMHLTGKQGKINKNKMSCSINYSDSTQIQRKHNKNRQISYNGIVWCINTDIGNFMARRNGKIFFTGNSGFPKSLDVSKAIDKKFGKEAEREIIGYKRQGTKSMFDGGKPRPATLPAARWQGWGTALKPAFEPIILARKPISEKNIAENVLKWGTGGINIDDCRVETDDTYSYPNGPGGCKSGDFHYQSRADTPAQSNPLGRWPANFIHDGSDEVLELFPETTPSKQSERGKVEIFKKEKSWIGESTVRGHNDSGSAARFFYCAKASKRERNKGCEGLEAKNLAGSNKWTDVDYRKGNGEITAQPQKNHHPTVKPLSLMQYLIRLVTPPNGTVLDPFAGSGSTLVAAVREQFKYVGIEMKRLNVEVF